MQWAEEYEEAENFQEAANIFQMGLRQTAMSAEERELLKTAKRYNVMKNLLKFACGGEGGGIE